MVQRLKINFLKIYNLNIKFLILSLKIFKKEVIRFRLLIILLKSNYKVEFVNNMGKDNLNNKIAISVKMNNFNLKISMNQKI